MTVLDVGVRWASRDEDAGSADSAFYRRDRGRCIAASSATLRHSYCRARPSRRYSGAVCGGGASVATFGSREGTGNSNPIAFGIPGRAGEHIGVQFDLLCSDLSTFPVARAVAASAAYRTNRWIASRRHLCKDLRR